MLEIEFIRLFQVKEFLKKSLNFRTQNWRFSLDNPKCSHVYIWSGRDLDLRLFIKYNRGKNV